MEIFYRISFPRQLIKVHENELKIWTATLKANIAPHKIANLGLCLFLNALIEKFGCLPYHDTSSA
jgi:hypothetical protein